MSWIVDPVSQVELWVPEYATPQRAIAREALRREGRLRQIRFFPDYCARWPLWDAETLDGLAIAAELSPGLRDALTLWREEFDRDFDPFAGWRTADQRDAWLLEGDRLLTRLERELWDSAEVVPHFRTYSSVREAGTDAR